MSGNLSHLKDKKRHTQKKDLQKISLITSCFKASNLKLHQSIPMKGTIIPKATIHQKNH